MLLRLLPKSARAGLLAVLFVAAAHAQTCNDTPADKAAVADTLRTMYAAAISDDLAKFHSIAASSFYAFDNGKRFDGDALMVMAKKAHDKGYVYVWTVNDPDVHIDCDTAWITYTNKGSVQPSPSAAVIPLIWLESAVLHRYGGTWKIEFFSSALVPEAHATNSTTSH